MNFLWLLIPVIIAVPLFLVTMSVNIIASRAQLRLRQTATSEIGNLDGK